MTSCLSPSSYCYDNNIPSSCITGISTPYFYNIASISSCAINCSSGMLRSPASSKGNAICNLPCDPNSSSCSTILASNDYTTLYTCIANYSRFGYHCILTSYLNTGYLNFNRCYNFPSVYVTFTPTVQSLTANGYYLEFAFKMDFVNEFCANPTGVTARKYVLFTVPHSFFIDLTSTSTSALLSYEINTATSLKGSFSYNLYEWNIIIVKTTIINNVTSINIYLNYNLTPVITLISSSLPINLIGMGFCNANMTPCIINSISYSLNWASVFYKNIRVWDYSSTNFNTIVDFGTGLY